MTDQKTVDDAKEKLKGKPERNVVAFLNKLVNFKGKKVIQPQGSGRNAAKWEKAAFRKQFTRKQWNEFQETLRRIRAKAK